MSTILTAEADTVEVMPRTVLRSPNRRLALWAAVLSIVVGSGAVLGGLAGAWFTYDQAASQQITTPSDAYFPEAAVRGPLTMWAQMDIITTHQLDRTGGLYYAEMPGQIPAVDDAGDPVLDEAGNPVMVPNPLRASWINATALTTALSTGILAYAMAALAVAVGAVLVFNGLFILSMRPVRL